jgi:hypothetical protein
VGHLGFCVSVWAFRFGHVQPFGLQVSYIKELVARVGGSSEIRFKHCATWEYHPSGDDAVGYLSYRVNCCEGSCVHQRLLGSVLRCVVYLHVAC